MKIEYFLNKNEYIAKTVLDDYSDDVTLSLCNEIDGRLVIGTTVLDITHGECKIKDGTLPDGTHEPFAVIDEKCLPLESFKKEGRIVTLGTVADGKVRELIRDFADTKKTVNEISDALFEISEKISHTTIF